MPHHVPSAWCPLRLVAGTTLYFLFLYLYCFCTHFLACLCNRNMKYIGKGTHLGYRIINNHMSKSISGISTCNFLRHVCNCRKVNKNLKEPSRSLCCDELNVSNLLIDYESRKFRQGYAFMSRPDTLNSLSRRQHTTTLINMSATLILLALYN